MKIDPSVIWAANYRLLMAVITEVSPEISALGLEMKELFLLARVDDSPHPAELAVALGMPKPTVTVYVKRLEAAHFLERAIDPGDLRRHRLTITPLGRKVLARGMALVSDAFGSRLQRLGAAERKAFAAALDTMLAPPKRA
ncbi:MAG: MarR family transcriptional regulator [Polyangiaceae bacterium]